MSDPVIRKALDDMADRFDRHQVDYLERVIEAYGYRQYSAGVANRKAGLNLSWDDVRMLEDLDRPDLASRIAALLPPKRG